MTKKITLSLFLLITTLGWAQQGDASAYSFFGIGDLKLGQTVENRATGGVAIQADSTHLNFQNPASHGALRLTTVSFGGNYSNLSIKDQNTSGRAARSAFDYFAVGLPLGKVGVVGGLKPVSTVGYDLVNYSTNTTDKGHGGVNQFFLSTGVQVMPRLHIGAEFNYNFGNITTERVTKDPNIALATQTKTRSDISGIGYKFGIMYTHKMNEKHNLFGSVAYAASANITSTNSSTLATLNPNSFNSQTPFDSKSIKAENTSVKIPGQMSIGLGYGELKKWFVGAQITAIQSSQLSNRLKGSSNASFEDGMRYSIGAHYTPKHNSYNNYFKKATYRLGFRTENTGLVVNNTSINEYGITFGLGLPTGGNFSSINIGFEYGSRGTTTANLVKEDFFTVVIGLSLNDKWFKKSKID